jgi:glutamate 5-kinase
MPSTALRNNVIARTHHAVIKLGTQLLTGADGRLDPPYLAEVAAQVAALRRRGIAVTLVSSGAVGAGCGVLQLGARPTDVSVAQAVASVGQTGLMSCWEAAFRPHGLHVGQMLLTRQDFDDRQRYLNIRNCIGELHELNAIPVINENDTVSVEEIRFGDNDILAALLCNALRADLLVLLSVVDGLKDADGAVLDIVRDTADARALIMRERTAMGSGGMQTKLEAARLVTDAGEVAVIANGRAERVLPRLLEGEKLGTVFVPAERKLDSRARWIGMTVRPAGTLTVNDGAAEAIARRGASLLAIGIDEITGRFEKGDVVLVRDQRGREIARGLTNYAADEARRIRGRRSDEFEAILGRQAYEEVIHRDNMVLTLPAERAAEPSAGPEPPDA